MTTRVPQAEAEVHGWCRAAVERLREEERLEERMRHADGTRPEAEEHPQARDGQLPVA